MMAVYVDTLRKCTKSRSWKWDVNCYLFAESYEELHRFAALLGLSHAWFIGERGKVPCYRLAPHHRIDAIQRRAIALSGKTYQDTYSRLQRIYFSSTRYVAS